MAAPLRVGLIGLGHVGAGVARILHEHSDRMTQRTGRPVVLKSVAVRDLRKPRDYMVPTEMMTDRWQSVVQDPEVDVVIELIGGLNPARQLVLEALKHGKDVVTANKALLCEHGPELFDVAKKAGRAIAFEAAVAGGIPIIHVLGAAMTANQVIEIRAILNGTSNFILSEMFHKGADYGDTVQKAQMLGYAEADPSMDVNGTDAAQKLSLLAQLAFGTRATPSQFLVQGIEHLKLADLKNADGLGYRIKLLATAKLVVGKLEMHVQPTLVRRENPIAQTEGPYNIVALDGDAVGRTVYSGRGAGQLPTASSVVADLVDVAIGRAQLTFPRLELWHDGSMFPLQPIEQIRRRYYMRFEVLDQPHVIADITAVLGRNQISISSVLQPEVPEVESGVPSPKVPLVIMTHRCQEGQLRSASEELKKLTCLQGDWICLPVSD
jgi:homoserine dehydrogenase